MCYYPNLNLIKSMIRTIILFSPMKKQPPLTEWTPTSFVDFAKSYSICYTENYHKPHENSISSGYWNFHKTDLTSKTSALWWKIKKSVRHILQRHIYIDKSSLKFASLFRSLQLSTIQLFTPPDAPFHTIVAHWLTLSIRQTSLTFRHMASWKILWNTL